MLYLTKTLSKFGIKLPISSKVEKFSLNYADASTYPVYYFYR